MDKEFFAVVQKRIPSLPKILHANDILNAPDRDEFIQKSIHQSEAISRKVIDRLKYEGGYLNGKNTISIVERAARVYTPAPGQSVIKAKSPKPAIKVEEKEEVRPAVNVEEINFNAFTLDPAMSSGEAINNYFLFPDLFEFNVRDDRVNSPPENKLNQTSTQPIDIVVSETTVKMSPRVNIQVQLPTVAQRSILDSSAAAVAEYERRINESNPNGDSSPFIESFDFLFP